MARKKNKSGPSAPQRAQGFSMVELIMVVFVFSVLVTISYVTLLSGASSWQATSETTELNQELRKGMEWMMTDLLQAGASTVTDVPADDNWYNAITFKIPSAAGVSGGTIEWASSTTNYALASSGSISQLKRTVGGQQKIIGQYITSLQIRRQSTSPEIVDVILGAQKNTPKTGLIDGTLSFSAKLRN